jgi:hypothetical protein
MVKQVQRRKHYCDAFRIFILLAKVAPEATDSKRNQCGLGTEGPCGPGDAGAGFGKLTL